LIESILKDKNKNYVDVVKRLDLRESYEEAVHKTDRAHPPRYVPVEKKRRQKK
jgi:hypothetical protein